MATPSCIKCRSEVELCYVNNNVYICRVCNYIQVITEYIHLQKASTTAVTPATVLLDFKEHEKVEFKSDWDIFDGEKENK